LGFHQVGARQVRAFQPGVIQSRLLEARLLHGGVLEICLVEQGAVEISAGEVGFLQVGIEQVCSSQVSADIDKGVNLLHSFWYDEARNTFIAVEKQEPDCAIAYWGHAMGYYQQVEQLPTGDELAQGKKAIAAAQAAQHKTPRESAYINALALIYDDKAAPKKTETTK